MNIYYIRSNTADFATVLSVGKKLGAIASTVLEDNSEHIYATEGGAWDFIGPIHDAEGVPLKDVDGIEYVHVNLATPINLIERASSLSNEDPEVAELLSQLQRFFLLDEQGNARAPSQPFRVFF